MIENLKQAIKLAKGPAEGMYTRDGKPYCIIGQLYVLEGGNVKDLEEWEDQQIWDIPNRGCLDKYPIAVLRSLQTTWDDDEYEGGEEDRRSDMLTTVEYYEENPHLFK